MTKKAIQSNPQFICALTIGTTIIAILAATMNMKSLMRGKSHVRFHEKEGLQFPCLTLLCKHLKQDYENNFDNFNERSDIYIIQSRHNIL